VQSNDLFHARFAQSVDFRVLNFKKPQGKSIYYPVSPICAYLTFLMHKHVASIQYKETIAAAISKITVNSGKKLHLKYTQSTKKVQFRWIGNIRRINAFVLKSPALHLTRRSPRAIIIAQVDAAALADSCLSGQYITDRPEPTRAVISRL